MKLFLALIVILYFIVDVHTAVIPSGFYDGEMAMENPEIIEVVDDKPLPELKRLKRFSCDIFSFQSQWVSPNHSVCAGKCIGMGYRGGSCDGTTCVCRRDRIFG